MNKYEASLGGLRVKTVLKGADEAKVVVLQTGLGILKSVVEECIGASMKQIVSICYFKE